MPDNFYHMLYKPSQVILFNVFYIFIKSRTFKTHWINRSIRQMTKLCAFLQSESSKNIFALNVFGIRIETYQSFGIIN